jgi:hypothetical protein
MVYRFLPLGFLTLALAFLVSQSAFADEHKGHHGQVVKAGDGKLTMVFKGDTKKHTHKVSPHAKVTRNGKKAKLKDLHKGDHVEVTMDDDHVITNIVAHATKKKE